MHLFHETASRLDVAVEMRVADPRLSQQRAVVLHREGDCDHRSLIDWRAFEAGAELTADVHERVRRSSVLRDSASRVQRCGNYEAPTRASIRQDH